MKKLLFVLAFMILPTAVEATELTAYTSFEMGKAFPSANLASFLIDGTAYRIDLFGGAKLQNIKFLNAIGLGLDFTYTNWRPLNAEVGFRYRQYQWDMFQFPFQIGWFVINPGLIWMVTDVGIPHLGIDQTSIRPGADLTVGMRVPLLPHFNLRADGRIQRVLGESLLTSQGTRFNVTGQTYSWFAGVEAYF